MFFYWECKAGQIIIYVFHTFKCLNYLHYSKLKRLQKILNEQLKEPLSYCSGQNQTNQTVYGHHIIVTGVDLSGCPTSTIRSCFRALDHPHTYPLFVSPSSSRTTPPPPTVSVSHPLQQAVQQFVSYSRLELWPTCESLRHFMILGVFSLTWVYRASLHSFYFVRDYVRYISAAAMIRGK